MLSGFHINQKFGEAFPDSALLIIVGLGLGFLLKESQVSDTLFRLDSTTFFLYLLPPIIFDAGTVFIMHLSAFPWLNFEVLPTFNFLSENEGGFNQGNTVCFQVISCQIDSSLKTSGLL